MIQESADVKVEAHRTLFAILARGGSKRLPGKNLLEVGAVSLLGRAIQCARACASRLTSDCTIVVSTDDDMIATEARRWGAEVPFTRSADLASDAATSMEALRHMIDWYATHGDSFSEVVLLQPTSPFRLTGDVLRCIHQFRKNPNATCVTVAYNPNAEKAWQFELRDGMLFTPVAATVQSNEDSTVALNGAVYVSSSKWIQENESLCASGRSMGIVMPAHRSIDIDVNVRIREA